MRNRPAVAHCGLPQAAAPLRLSVEISSAPSASPGLFAMSVIATLPDTPPAEAAEKAAAHAALKLEKRLVRQVAQAIGDLA